jgi:multiple sugar transport system substrate-binding protein
VSIALSDVEVPLYESLLVEFESKHPDIDVQIASVEEILGLGALGNREIPDDAEERLVAGADVVKIGISRDTVRKGLVRDLSPLIEVDSSFDAGDFLKGTLERYQWSGGQWALPISVYWRIMYFDKDAFDGAGVAYPEAGWTWDDLEEKARALTMRQGDEVTQWGFACPTTLAYRVVESRAGGLADHAVEPPKPALDSEGMVDALEWYAALYLEDQVMPYGGRPSDDDQTALRAEDAAIDKGLAAMWPDVDLLHWYRKIQGNVGVAPFPVSESNGNTSPAWTTTLAMSAGTRQPDAAWRLMVFLSRQVVSGVGQGARQMPARRSAAQESGQAPRRRRRHPGADLCRRTGQARAHGLDDDQLCARDRIL